MLVLLGETGRAETQTKILPLGSRNQSCRNFQLETSFQIAACSTRSLLPHALSLCFHAPLLTLFYYVLHTKFHKKKKHKTQPINQSVLTLYWAQLPFHLPCNFYHGWWLSCSAQITQSHRGWRRSPSSTVQVLSCTVLTHKPPRKTTIGSYWLLW